MPVGAPRNFLGAHSNPPVLTDNFTQKCQLLMRRCNTLLLVRRFPRGASPDRPIEGDAGLLSPKSVGTARYLAENRCSQEDYSFLGATFALFPP